MFKLTEEQKNKRAKKIAEEQDISHGEAMDLVNILSGGNDSLADFQQDTGEDTYEEIKSDAIDQDFDLQMNHNSMGAEDLHSAQTGLSSTVAKMRNFKKNKIAIGEEKTPEQQRIDRLMMRSQEDKPDVAPERHEYARSMFTEMQGNNPNANEDEDLQLYEELLEDEDPQNVMAKRMAAYADARFGVPESEGKLYRSNIDPRIFKSAAGNKFQLKISNTMAPGTEVYYHPTRSKVTVIKQNLGGGIPTITVRTDDGEEIEAEYSDVSVLNVPPKDNSHMDRFHELNPHMKDSSKKAIGEDVQPTDMAAQAPSVENVQEPQPAASTGVALEENEKQRLAQIITDAESNGSSAYRLLGLVAGFMGDNNLMGIASSEQESGELKSAFREGAIARGGNAQRSASKKALLTDEDAQIGKSGPEGAIQYILKICKENFLDSEDKLNTIRGFLG